jgi:glycosyltransferase involved in cell wall biosynthesis
MLPSITIITPSYNQGRFIGRTIESVLSQNYPRLEYIVIDGGSTDETLLILKKYGSRIQWISEKDSGQSSAINKGFRMATGDIVAWLNSDDIYLPGSLQKIGAYFQAHTDVMMVYGEGYIIDEHDEVKSRFPFTEPQFDLWKLIYFGDYILQQTTFYRRGLFDSLDMLDEDLHYGMDWDLFIRIGKRFKIDYLPEYLGCIREHGGAKTSTGGLRRLMRRHGLQRYPPAYFNYAWDVLGPHLSGDAINSEEGKRRRSRYWLSLLLRKIQFLLRARMQQGLYPDGWLGRKAMIVLPKSDNHRGRTEISLTGECHAINVPLQVQIKVNKRLAIRRRIDQAGIFHVSAQLPPECDKADSYHIEIDSSRGFVPLKRGLSSDSRVLAFHLKSIDIAGKGASIAQN